MTGERKHSPIPERNPFTRAVHRREVFFQIALPLIIGGILILALAVGVIVTTVQGTGDSSRWADVSLIWLLLPAFPLALLLIALVVGVIVGTTYLLGITPGYMRLIHLYLMRIQAKIQSATDKAVSPFIRSQSFLAGWRAFWHRDTARREPASQTFTYKNDNSS